MHNILKMTGLGEDARWEIVGSTPSLEKVFTDASLIISQAGAINLHYTCHHVNPASQRDFQTGEWLFLDVDKITDYSPDKVTKYIDALSITIGIDRKYIWGISSGNGVHLLIKIQKYNLDYLEVHKSTYTKLCADFKTAFTSFGLTGEMDLVFNKAKSLRLPNTLNRKEGLDDKKCELVQRGEEYGVDILTKYRKTYDQSFDLEHEIKKMAVALANSQKNHALPAIIQKADVSVNNIASKHEILEKCSFVGKLKTDLPYLPREEWLRGVSLLTTLNMEEEAHEWSSISPVYKHSETEEIINSTKAKDLFPTSCAKIQETFNKELVAGCASCPYKSCKSPARLFTDETILAMSQGFQILRENKKGETVNVGINYFELANFCYKYLHTFKVEEHDMIYSWNFDDHIYEPQDNHSMAKKFNDLIRPRPLDPTETLHKGLNSMAIEHRKKEKEVLPPEGFIPLQNGWLNAFTGDLESYTPKFLVTQKIPTVYDPIAKCPHFEKFLKERIGDEETISVVLDFMCYALAGIKHPNRKILVLEGPQGTGKTTLVTVFEKLFGYLATQANLKHLVGRFETASFVDKRLVIFDEAPQEKDSSLIEVLKNLSGSPTMRVERKNENATTAQNLARLVISCNAIPRGGAMDSGFMDRLLIVPMHNQIEVENRDSKEVDAILGEMSGVLNLVLKQYKKLSQKNFQIFQSAVTQTQADNYQRNSDPIAAFIEENVDFVACPPDMPSYYDRNCVFGSEETCILMKNFKEVFARWASEEVPYWTNISSAELKKRLEFLSKTLYKKKYFFDRTAKNKNIVLCGMRFKNRQNLQKDPNPEDRF